MTDFNAKSKAAYNRIADDYDNSPDGKFTREFKYLLVKSIGVGETIDVLDVACGNGSFLAMLNKQRTIKGFGIDISDRMIENAVINNPDMEFHVSGCEAMPFQSNTMDLVTVCAAYHHFPDVAAFAKEAKRVLKAKGKIYIADIYLPSFLRFICNPFVPLSKAGDVKFYAPDEIVKQFKQFGFETMDVIISSNIQIISMQKI